MREIPAGAPLPEHAARTIDATGKVVAPGFIDLHSHGGLVILAEPRHEPKVRQGVTTEIVGVDGNGFAPFERREDLEAFVRLDAGLDGDPDASTTTGAPWPSTWRATTGRSASTSARSSGTASSGSGPSAGTTTPPTTGPSTTCGRPCATRCSDGAVGLSSGLDYPPGSFATTEELASSPARRRATAASITATSATDSATDSSIRSARRSRSAGAARRLPPHPLLSPPDAPGPSGRAPRGSSTTPAGGPRRHLRFLPVRMGEHPPADPAPAMGPGRRTGAAQGTARRNDAPASGSVPRSRPVAARRPARPAGRTSASATSGGPRLLRWESRTVADVMAETGTTRSTSCATCSWRRTWRSTR